MGSSCSPARINLSDGNGSLAAYRSRTPAAIALSVLFDRYCAANTHWRPTTLANAKARWRKFELYGGPGRLAHTVTPDLLDRFRAELKRMGHAANQAVEMVKVARRVPAREAAKAHRREPAGRIHGPAGEGRGAHRGVRVHPGRVGADAGP